MSGSLLLADHKHITDRSKKDWLDFQGYSYWRFIGILFPENILKSWWWRWHPGKGDETLLFQGVDFHYFNFFSYRFFGAEKRCPPPKHTARFTPENQWLLQMMHLRLEMVTFQGQTRGKHRPLLMHLDEPVVWTPSRPGTWHAYLLRDFFVNGVKENWHFGWWLQILYFLNWETKDFDFYEALLFWFIQSSSSQCLNPASVFLSHGMHWYVRLCLVVHQTRRTCGTNEQVRCMQT